jgi:hypothetical protein
MKFDKFALTAMTGLLLASAQMVQAEEAKVDETVLCYGVNSCKAQGACGGKVDACSGKNACSTEVTCAGHNTCKGKGLVKLTKKECLDKKGTIAQAK